MISNNKIKRGEIYFADLGVNVGSVQGNIRPVIIVSNEQNNKFSPTVQVIPVTSKIKNLPVHIMLNKNCGLNQLSMALCEQETTVDKTMLRNKVGEVDELTMKQINKAIKIQKDIYSPFCIENFVNKFINQYKIKNEKLAKVLEKELTIHCEKYNIDYQKQYA
jgi:mRNA interferase MazF